MIKVGICTCSAPNGDHLIGCPLRDLPHGMPACPHSLKVPCNDCAADAREQRDAIEDCTCGARRTKEHYLGCPLRTTPERPFHPARTLRPYTSAERKEMPVHSFMAYYFPDAIAAGARHSKKANDKHNPGEHVHWARHKSTDHLECAARHLLTPDAIDADTGEIELVAAMWRCMAALQLREEKRLIAAGIMPLSGVVNA